MTSFEFDHSKTFFIIIIITVFFLLLIRCVLTTECVNAASHSVITLKKGWVIVLTVCVCVSVCYLSIIIALGLNAKANTPQIQCHLPLTLAHHYR